MYSCWCIKNVDMFWVFRLLKFLPMTLLKKLMRLISSHRRQCRDGDGFRPTRFWWSTAVATFEANSNNEYSTDRLRYNIQWIYAYYVPTTSRANVTMHQRSTTPPDKSQTSDKTSEPSPVDEADECAVAFSTLWVIGKLYRRAGVTLWCSSV